MPGPITGISSMATRRVLEQLAQTYTARTGCDVSIQSMGGVAAAERVRAREPFDVVVLAAPVMERLEAEGALVAKSRTSIVRSGIAAAVRAGAVQPPFESEEAVKAAMLSAKRVCYSTGPSGDHLQQLWARWGVESQMKSRVVRTPPGVPVASFIEEGKADLGFQQLSELLGQPGIDVVGSLPAVIQHTTIFVAGIGAQCTQEVRVRALIEFFASPEASDAKVRFGMDAL